METTDNIVPIRKPFECAVCGEKNGRTQFQDVHFNYGKGDAQVSLTANVPVDFCSECGEEVLGDGAEELRHEAVCKYLGVQTPREIHSLRKFLGMSREQLAEVTGIGSASVARWESGTHIQNVALDRYLRLLSKPGVLPILLGLVEEGETEAVRPRFQCLQINSAILKSAARFSLN